MEDPVTGDPIARAMAEQERVLRGGGLAAGLRATYDPDSPSRTHSMTLREVRACAISAAARMSAGSAIFTMARQLEHYILTGEVPGA